MDYKTIIREEEIAKHKRNQLIQSIKDKFKEEVKVFVSINYIEVVLKSESIDKPLSWFNNLLEEMEAKSLQISVVPKTKTHSKYIHGKTKYDHFGTHYDEGKELIIFDSVSLEMTLKFKI